MMDFMVPSLSKACATLHPQSDANNRHSDSLDALESALQGN